MRRSCTGVYDKTQNMKRSSDRGKLAFQFSIFGRIQIRSQTWLLTDTT